jgi:hypothetical protein
MKPKRAYRHKTKSHHSHGHYHFHNDTSWHRPNRPISMLVSLLAPSHKVLQTYAFISCISHAWN